jgi:hypothetical protein
MIEKISFSFPAFRKIKRYMIPERFTKKDVENVKFQQETSKGKAV